MSDDGGFMSDISNISNMRSQVWSMFQSRVNNWAGNLRSEINKRRQRLWLSDDQAQGKVETISDQEIAERALTDAFNDVQEKSVETALRYLEVQNNPAQGTDQLKIALSELLIELHNPSTREAILLAVKDEYRDDVRDRFEEFSKMIWGIIDLSQGNPTDNFWFVANVVSAHTGDDITEIVDQVDGIKRSDIPSEYR